ncbi:MAG: sigma-54-dependent Fis family transcriptional regulator [Alphaproteobacteria bacterium]|nr:sigma-54-dependent Fis family transcriptional regulator [Alphaproteobacteria bacterium]
MSVTPVILIIDDEDDIRMLIAGILEDEGYDVLHAATSDMAMQIIDEYTPDLVIQDIWLQGSDKDGIEILRAAKKTNPNLPFLMISGHGTIETAVSAIKAGAYDFIEKPFKSDRLLLMINRALENAALKKQNTELRQKTSQSVFNHVKQLPDYVRNILDKSAGSNSRIFITGEVGTGKSTAAHYVHEKSLRAMKPFMTLSCTTLDPGKLEKELFGAHPGEKEYRTPGLLQLVEGGTLLLDEVSALPMETQGKLLNILQDKAYYKTGSNQKIPVDVRVISTSSEDVEAKINSGEFRKDLYYRLNVVPVELAPLSKRKNDILELISLLSPLDFSEQALIKLKAYSWPGNIKQLHNVLEWISLMHENKVLPVDVSQLPQEIWRSSTERQNSSSAENDNFALSDDILSMSLREAREIFERHYLLSQINRFDGNISKTAEFIGMERSALHRKLKSLEVFSSDKQNVA